MVLESHLISFRHGGGGGNDAGRYGRYTGAGSVSWGAMVRAQWTCFTARSTRTPDSSSVSSFASCIACNRDCRAASSSSRITSAASRSRAASSFFTASTLTLSNSCRCLSVSLAGASLFMRPVSLMA